MGELEGVMHRRTSPQIFSNSRELRHNQTEAEAKLWQVLRSHQLCDIHFRRQQAIGPYIVDFSAPRHKLVIELDGGQHLDQQEYDLERTVFLESKGYRVLRFWNDEVLKNRDGVLRVIIEAIIGVQHAN
jgi:very-short-patch-repair endonuclease